MTLLPVYCRYIPRTNTNITAMCITVSSIQIQSSYLCYSLTADALYEASNKHTYPVMTVLLSAVATVLCTFCLLYKSLAPRADKNSYNSSLEEEMNIVCNDGNDAENLDQSVSTEELKGESHIDQYSAEMSTSDCDPSTVDQDSPKQGIQLWLLHHSTMNGPILFSHKTVWVIWNHELF